MFHFTIRDMLLLTVIAALSIAWWMEHSTRSRLSAELNSRNDELAAMRAGLEKGPVHFFNVQTERLRQELKKRGPLTSNLLRPRKQTPYLPQDDPMGEAISARKQLEREAEAAGYAIRIREDGPKLEPKWEGTWNERPSTPGEL